VKSLQGRLLLLVLTAVLLVWGAAAVWTWRDARHELDELLDGHLAQAAALLVVQQAGEPPDDDAGVYAPKLHRYAPRVAFQVWHEGVLSMRSSNAPAGPLHSGPVGNQAGFQTVAIDGKPWRVFATYGAERDVQVYVGEQVDAREAILRALLRGTMWPLALALPLLGLAAWWAVRQGLQPLRRLSSTLRKRQPQALEPVLLPQAPDEMQPMVQALNGLLQRIGGMVESERRFTADAAHELRTPLAAIRTQAQVALAEAGVAARRHALQATLQGCDRATRLVDQLLTLSRLESAGPPNWTAVDLAALARGVAGELAPEALARQQDLALEADKPCPVQGDATLLAVLVRNLLDNASRYSPVGATLRLVVAPSASGQVLLDMQDSGPGLAEADRARLGERFFRVLGSGASGSGLGWSIVRRIAAAHAATVEVGRSASLGGLQVAVRFSAAA
jgi:two-component system, OmpR family, sensor histidine kinase QseC